MSLFDLPIGLVSLVLTALATAGIYVTMKSIPQAVEGVYRMHIYAPPAAFFLGAAAFICMIAPFTGMVPADEISIGLSTTITGVFAVVGIISLTDAALLG